MVNPVFRTRFAPSPTGGLHLGGARTALFNYLRAAGQGGSFVLRIEDTDLDRSTEAHSDALQRELQWLGLRWEGEALRQSERGEVYVEHLTRLVEIGRAYPCWRTDAELAEFRRERMAAGRPPIYDREWGRLPADEIGRRGAAGQRPVMRFRVPDRGSVSFVDLVRGEQRIAVADIGDFVVQRSDGSTPFFFSNAVDDAVGGISEVLRGEDHLTNTARQLLLFDALGLAAPRYGHLPLVVDADGAPLAKRRGAPTLTAMAEDGLLPAAVTNYAARLGHVCEGGELLGLQALASQFSLDRIGRSPAHYDAVQLEHWQHLALQACDPEELEIWAGEETLAPVPPAERRRFVELVRPNVARPGDVRWWSQIVFGEGAPETEGADEIVAAGPAFFEAAVAAIENESCDLKGIAAAVGAATAARGRSLYRPLRLALTGVGDGPELGPLLAMMGPERAKARLARWAGHALEGSDRG